MNESSGPGGVSAPSRELGGLGPSASLGALPDLGELRRLAEAATPGPWEWHDGTMSAAPGTGAERDAMPWMKGLDPEHETRRTPIIETDGGFYPPRDNDRAFFAAVHPQVVLALLGRHESALGRLRVLETGHTAVVHDLRITNQRLNRRCQQAEAAAARSADSVKAELYGRRKGKPLGRMLANIRLTELEAAADALADAMREHLLGSDNTLEVCAALAAYRAVRSKEATK